MAFRQVEYKKRILLLYRTFGPSVNLCGFIQLQKLAENGEIEFVHKRILNVKRDELEWAEIVAFVRGDALLDESLAKACHDAGKYVLYILDDDLLNVPMYLGSGQYYSQASVRKHITNMMRYSNCFASPSQQLLSKYGSLFDHSFLIVEPAVFQKQEKMSWKDGRVRIGFAGSADRGSDIDTILSEVLPRIVDCYGERIQLEFFGTETLLAKKLKCRTYPYMDSYLKYQQVMEKLNWDIGLAPMPDSPFHACKHYNKLVEYCGFGIAGVYSNVLPYAGAVEDGITGLLCENSTESWFKALSRLIEDKRLRERISQNCIKRAHGIFSVETAAKKMGNDLALLPVMSCKRIKVICLGWLKLKGLLSWYMEKFKKYGAKTPIIAIKKLIQLCKREV